MKKLILATVAVATLFAASGANAATLIDEKNTARLPTAYTFNITANSNNTALTFSGYQLPFFSNVAAISVTALGSATNLLAQSWAFTPAACGSLAGQSNLGGGTNALTFGGYCENSYDSFSQNFASVAGGQYLVNFIYTNAPGRSGFRAETTAALTAAVPEPGVWALMLLGFAAVGGMMRLPRRKDRLTVRYT